MPQIEFQSAAVKAVFDAYDPVVRERMLALRQCLFDVAAENPAIGPIEETLKWGQPSYLTPKTKSGTTVRFDAIAKEPGTIGLYVHCQTTLADTYRTLYGDELDIDGKRCVKLGPNIKLPSQPISHCIELALTYHLNKRKDELPF